MKSLVSHAECSTSLWEKSYSYDGDDNIVAITDGVDLAKSVTYSYDAVSRLTRATGDLNGIGREDYVYDGNGNRLELQRRLLPTDATPIETAISVRTPGTNRLASVTSGGQLRQLAYDGRGNVATDTRSGIPLSLTYDAYGRLTSYVAPSATMRTSAPSGSSGPLLRATAIRRLPSFPLRSLCRSQSLRLRTPRSRSWGLGTSMLDEKNSACENVASLR